jgi:DNA invertase Pin-like site-specific DNA recombinase
MTQSAVIYSRVSTNKQDAVNQIKVLESWAQERGLEVIAVYTETEPAWRDGHQQEPARLVRHARKGRFRFVLVWALDRLSRLGSLSILSLIHRLATYGVKALSHQGSWTEGPRGTGRDPLCDRRMGSADGKPEGLRAH